MNSYIVLFILIVTVNMLCMYGNEWITNSHTLNYITLITMSSANTVVMYLCIRYRNTIEAF